MTTLAGMPPLVQAEPHLLVRVVDVDGLPATLRGATRAHRLGGSPHGHSFGSGLDEALVQLVDSALADRRPTSVTTVPVPGSGSATVVLQWSTDLPATAWDLLRAGCTFALHTRWQAGQVSSRTVVRAPSAVADPNACHALDLLLSGTSQVVLTTDDTSTRLVETFCAARRLVCVGTGSLAHALADACPMTLWTFEQREVTGADDLDDLTPLDLLVVLDTSRAWDVVALGLASPVGHIGLVDPAVSRLDGPAIVQERLHVLDPADADCPPAEQAIVVLAELMASRREQARRTWGSFVLAE